MNSGRRIGAAVLAIGLPATTGTAQDRAGDSGARPLNQRQARNVIFFVGDGMGVSTVTATRVMSVGVDGKLVLDQFPYTALSRTYSEDSITADSAPTMTAMMTGVNTNQSVIGFGTATEPNDFNRDGDGPAPWTLLELAKARGMKVGVVSTAQITHATPAATYAHINQRNNENDITGGRTCSCWASNVRRWPGCDRRRARVRLAAFAHRAGEARSGLTDVWWNRELALASAFALHDDAGVTRDESHTAGTWRQFVAAGGSRRPLPLPSRNRPGQVARRAVSAAVTSVA